MQNLTSSIKDSGVLAIIDKLSSISGGRILDVGTCEGDFITTLKKTLMDYESFVGIDISEEYIEKARESFSDEPVEFEVMDAETLSFEDNSFDTVCISFTMHHLENVDIVLREMNRVLKPGGHLILQEMFSDSDQSEAKITEMLIHHLDAKVDRMSGIPHFETFKRQELKDFVVQLGMREVEVYESTKYVNCYSCEDLEGCEDHMDRVEYGIKEIDEILERAEGYPSISDIRHEAENLKERVRVTGHAATSLLFFICKK